MSSKRSAVNEGAGPGRGFNVSDFRSFRDAAGILRTHDFHIELPWPTGLIKKQEYNAVYNNVELTCESVNFPATGSVVHKMQRYSYGAVETRPTMPQFSDLQAVFVTDEHSDLWRFFHDWVQLSCNFDFDANPIQGGQMAAYEISYPEEYTVDFFLYIYDPYGTLVRRVGFRDAFPTMVGDCLLSWASGGQMIKVPVTFAFVDWNEYDVAGRSQVGGGQEAVLRSGEAQTTRAGKEATQIIPHYHPSIK